jgi:hypothetical protein
MFKNKLKNKLKNIANLNISWLTLVTMFNDYSKEPLVEADQGYVNTYTRLSNGAV